MESAHWFVAVGALLIAMTVVSATLRRLSLTAAIIYLLLGIALGHAGFAALTLDPVQNVSLFRLVTEITVIISLFTAGLKLRLPFSSPEWRVPLMLATVSMLMTVAIVAAVANLALELPLGAAVLLGAILSPTDPVLASSVQVLGPDDRDRLRFSLTSEAGLNDGTAFPFVILGMGLLGMKDLGHWGMRWVLVDVIWATFAGLAVGTILATGVGELIGILRRSHHEAESFDDFLAIGLISLSYGLTVIIHGYGFLAVFAAGLALRRRERQETHTLHPMLDDIARDRSQANSISGQMAKSLLHFNEQLERLGELIVVILLGVMLSLGDITGEGLLIALSLVFIARPVSVLLGVRVQKRSHKPLLAWFGIRGIGSLYYLAYSIEQGLAPELARTLTGITFMVVVISIVVHGLTSTRLMLRHERRGTNS